jgi:hypothetical protein
MYTVRIRSNNYWLHVPLEYGNAKNEFFMVSRMTFIMSYCKWQIKLKENTLWQYEYTFGLILILLCLKKCHSTLI